MQNLFKGEQRDHPRPSLHRIAQEMRGEIVDTFFCRPWSMWLERVTERQEKEIDVLVGKVLVRVRFEAAYRDERDSYAMLKCMITKIDDEEIGEKEQKEKAAIFESRETPTVDEQSGVFRQALQNWGIHGNAVAVTEKYVAGHLRLIALKKRSIQKKGARHVHH